MTRDEAISEACLVVQGRATRCAGSNLRIHEDCKKVVVHDFSHAHLCEFEWQEPRRIPPEGTPVKGWSNDPKRYVVAVSSGQTNEKGELITSFFMPLGIAVNQNLGGGCNCPNWIELVEATP